MSKTLDYNVFSSQIHGKILSQRVPANGSIEVSRRCPLECLHCYNNLPMGDRQAQLSELSYEEHCRILDELAEAGCLWLLYTGGEIFARKDFLEIYTYAKRKGFIITLFTNGTLINSRVADYLAEWAPFSIEITLYGRTKETYERLTRIPGSYDRCIQGIQNLKERGLPLKLKTVAVSVNRHEVWAMKEFADELGIEFKYDGMINPRIDCSMSPLEVRLKPYEVVEFDLRDQNRVEEFRGMAVRQREAGKKLNHDEVYHCGGGLNSFAIDPYGRMSICVLSQKDTYDLRKGSFRDAWEKFLFQVRYKKRTVLTKCVECGLKGFCSMCPANGELESGDAEKPVDFLCHVAHLRARVMDIDIPHHGECEFCVGGTKHHELQASLNALKESKEKVSNNDYKIPLLQLSNGCSSGGCSSCSTNAIHSKPSV